MSLTELFTRLGAPLANNRWSWGAQRASDGAVFLRVWQDLKLYEGGRRFMLVDRPADHPMASTSNGYQERLRHLEQVRSGKPCYLVMCIARDVDARPRAVQEFHDEDIFIGGELMERDGDVWIEVKGRQPIGTVLA